ncbi:MAG TPA: radical SAM protein [Bryobacterales bacterium]|nr:radical SAM protein [Bryobacterales bacterium]
MSKLQITEIFRSIQGESTRAGLPCTFIRLTGCNLRCTWCDTTYSFYGGTPMTLDQVLRKVADFGGKLVEITGGEPLLQQPVYPLMDRLLAEGYRVMLETSGERPINKVPREVIKIVDVKCPDSGEPETFLIENLRRLAPHDELKFVIGTRRDYEFSRDFTRQHELTTRVAAVSFSPVHGSVDLAALAKWMLDDGLEGIRFGSQLHKSIWGAEARGV